MDLLFYLSIIFLTASLNSCKLQLFSANHEYKQEIRVSVSGQLSSEPLQLVLVIAAATGVISILVLILSKNNGNGIGNIRNV